MKNDQFNDDLYEAFSNIDTEVSDLRTIAWIMECVADSGNCLPDGMFRADIDYLMAKLIARQAERIGKLTGPVQEQLCERRRAAR